MRSIRFTRAAPSDDIGPSELLLPRRAIGLEYERDGFTKARPGLVQSRPLGIVVGHLFDEGDRATLSRFRNTAVSSSDMGLSFTT